MADGFMPNFAPDLEGKLPPQAVEAECAVLGGLLMGDRTAYDRVADKINSESMYVPAHSKIWDAITALREKDTTPDLMTVTDYLKQRGTLDAVGGQRYLATLMDAAIGTASIDLYADIIQDKARRRQLGVMGAQFQQLQWSPDDWEKLRDRVEVAIASLSVQGRGRGLVSSADVMLEFWGERQSVALHEQPPGLPSGFYDLDGLLAGGFGRGELVIIAGRPAMGKTGFACQTVVNLAQSGLPVALFSLEMAKRHIFGRMAAADAGIDGRLIKAAQLTEDQWVRLSETCRKLSQLPMWFDDSSDPNLDYIKSQARALHRRYGGKLGGICVDYLQLMDTQSRAGMNESTALGKISRGLKMLAVELDCPVFALSQLSRGVESRQDKRPVMSDLRESGAIEQDADLVLMLYRDEYYYEDSPSKGIAELLVRKNRNGPTGTVKVLFDADYTRFRSLKNVY